MKNYGSFIELVRGRTSCRKYRTDPVPKEHIELMLEAARLAPSACNKQPWRFAVVTDDETRQRLVSHTFLPGISMNWAKDAPVFIVLGIEKSLVTHKVAPMISGVDYPLVDVGIAGEHLVLQAQELGLGTCWIGWVKPKEVRRVVDWPAKIEPVSLITVGWPDEVSEPRKRKDSDDIAKWI